MKSVGLAFLMIFSACGASSSWIDASRQSLAGASMSTTAIWDGARMAMDSRCGSFATACGRRGDLECLNLERCKELHRDIGMVVASVHSAIGSALLALASVEALLTQCEAQTSSEKQVCKTKVYEARIKALSLAARAMQSIEELRAKLGEEGLPWK